MREQARRKHRITQVTDPKQRLKLKKQIQNSSTKCSETVEGLRLRGRFAEFIYNLQPDGTEALWLTKAVIRSEANWSCSENRHQQRSARNGQILHEIFHLMHALWPVVCPEVVHDDGDSHQVHKQAQGSERALVPVRIEMPPAISAISARMRNAVTAGIPLAFIWSPSKEGFVIFPTPLRIKIALRRIRPKRGPYRCSINITRFGLWVEPTRH